MSINSATAFVAHLPLLLQSKEQLDEQDAAITAEMSKRLEPLWAALSATITQIEAKLPAHVDSSSEATSAAASILPPGAAQVGTFSQDTWEGLRKDPQPLHVRTPTQGFTVWTPDVLHCCTTQPRYNVNVYLHCCTTHASYNFYVYLL